MTSQTPAHSEDLSATAVVRKHLANVDQGIGPHLADAYATDTTVEQPFLPTDRRTLHGREELREHFAAAAALPLTMRVQNLVSHPSSNDPEVVIVEYDYEVTRPHDEAPTTLANVQVFRVRHGEIVESRDYHDHHRIRALLQPVR